MVFLLTFYGKFIESDMAKSSGELLWLPFGLITFRFAHGRTLQPFDDFGIVGRVPEPQNKLFFCRDPRYITQFMKKRAMLEQTICSKYKTVGFLKC